MAAVIEAQNLGKRYRLGGQHQAYATLRENLVRWALNPWRRRPAVEQPWFWALRGVSFEVQEGEVVGVIGRNGAGKSTLLKLMARITRPTEGRARVVGRVGSLLEVGTGFHPELTGRENIFMSGAILGMTRSEIKERFESIVEFAEVQRFLDTPVKHYSSGMQLRLGFAVAAHLEPEILLVDEVLAVGDVVFQKKCLGKMNQVARGGRTVFFVSHNMPAVRQLCSRALLIDQGRLVADGPVDQVVNQYLACTRAGDGKGVIPADAPRVDGTGQALLRRVRLQDLDGRRLGSVHFGQPFQVTALYQVLEPIDDAAVEVGISTADGHRVATITSLDAGGPLLAMTPGWWEVSVRIRAHLMPRPYRLDVAMHHMVNTHLTIDWVDGVLDFDALPVAQSGDDHYRDFASDKVRGYLRLAGDWSAPRPAERDGD